jgi:hypothetical protein
MNHLTLGHISLPLESTQPCSSLNPGRKGGAPLRSVRKLTLGRAEEGGMAIGPFRMPCCGIAGVADARAGSRHGFPRHTQLRRRLRDVQGEARSCAGLDIAHGAAMLHPCVGAQGRGGVSRPGGTARDRRWAAASALAPASARLGASPAREGGGGTGSRGSTPMAAPVLQPQRANPIRRRAGMVIAIRIGRTSQRMPPKLGHRILESSLASKARS